VLREGGIFTSETYFEKGGLDTQWTVVTGYSLKKLQE